MEVHKFQFSHGVINLIKGATQIKTHFPNEIQVLHVSDSTLRLNVSETYFTTLTRSKMMNILHL